MFLSLLTFKTVSELIKMWVRMLRTDEIPGMCVQCASHYCIGSRVVLMGDCWSGLFVMKTNVAAWSKSWVTNHPVKWAGRQEGSRGCVNIYISYSAQVSNKFVDILCPCDVQAVPGTPVGPTCHLSFKITVLCLPTTF